MILKFFWRHFSQVLCIYAMEFCQNTVESISRRSESNFAHIIDYTNFIYNSLWYLRIYLCDMYTCTVTITQKYSYLRMVSFYK